MWPDEFLQEPPVYAYFAKFLPEHVYFLSASRSTALGILPDKPLVRLADRDGCSRWAEKHYFETSENWDQLHWRAWEMIEEIMHGEEIEDEDEMVEEESEMIEEAQDVEPEEKKSLIVKLKLPPVRGNQEDETPLKLKLKLKVGEKAREELFEQ